MMMNRKTKLLVPAMLLGMVATCAAQSTQDTRAAEALMKASDKAQNVVYKDNGNPEKATVKSSAPSVKGANTGAKSIDKETFKADRLKDKVEKKVEQAVEESLKKDDF